MGRDVVDRSFLRPGLGGCRAGARAAIESVARTASVAFVASVASVASVAFVSSIGCGAPAMSVAPASAIPVAPSSGSGAIIDRPPGLPRPPVVAVAAPAPASPLADSPDEDAPAFDPPADRTAGVTGLTSAPGAAPVAVASNVAPRVLLVDELPFRVRPRSLPSALASSLTSGDAAPPSHKHARKHARHGRPYHPAPGIVVDVSDARGASAEEMQRIARSAGYWPFRHCYEEGLRRDQRLGGKVVMDVSIAPTGAIERTSVTATTLRDEVVVACVAREAGRLALANGAATARLQVLLATGDEPVPLARPVTDADDLRAALRASWPAVERCYSDALAGHPDAGGRMELHFRLGSGGEVVDVREGEERFSEPDAARCVADVYRSKRLTGHLGAGDGRFVYALHFEQAPAITAAR